MKREVVVICHMRSGQMNVTTYQTTPYGPSPWVPTGSMAAGADLTSAGSSFLPDLRLPGEDGQCACTMVGAGGVDSRGFPTATVREKGQRSGKDRDDGGK